MSSVITRSSSSSMFRRSGNGCRVRNSDTYRSTSWAVEGGSTVASRWAGSTPRRECWRGWRRRRGYRRSRMQRYAVSTSKNGRRSSWERRDRRGNLNTSTTRNTYKLTWGLWDISMSLREKRNYGYTFNMSCWQIANYRVQCTHLSARIVWEDVLHVLKIAMVVWPMATSHRTVWLISPRSISPG